MIKLGSACKVQPGLALVLRVALSCSDLSLRHLAQELTFREFEGFRAYA